ncbi:MAG: hypothetical protein FWF81_02550 [Defluviitaleaceae bacterium]|nr:hypothetical protein [Defluviitaleaceae bacterium]
MREKTSTAKKPRTKAVHEIPNQALEALARCLLPGIRSYFESDEGWREFAEWQLRKDIEELYGRELPDIIIRIAA